ncbi:hypothetical protein EJ05DRAFT_496831 [Pseudovirgaria hyperparasitica]|uniref:Zn(2)-C6 fungal-type domain-containing protein n=1 Tax=Pseudovirgaria hyperparasitica TaxID=470096 RepID=A0A6A6WIL4_9PEZI|nr:uncharacterized protein EJ05DRAFT_496831 [Pseudovirgaria hyperparasitica]KAF2761944.1 hypothetical protein EJ05DRAFT_496831 [Pseudovirgaria hyperparasitica]
MGRKPNQLITEYFERGPKLEDASNRYQHTCKSCGEKFPKGRIDSLINHLTKKCPALPVSDRQRALLQFHDLPELPETRRPSIAIQNGLPFTPKQSMSGLEALAEVSRQQLDLTGKHVSSRGGKKQHSRNTGEHGGTLLEDFLVSDDSRSDLNTIGVTDRHGRYTHHKEQNFNAHGPTQPQETFADFGLQFETLRQHVSSLPPLFPQSNSTLTAHDSPQPSAPPLGHNVVSTSSVSSPTLMMTASAAQNLMPDLTDPNVVLSDKFNLPATGRPLWTNLQNIDPSLTETTNPGPVSVSETQSKAVTTPTQLGSNMLKPSASQTHFTTDFSIDQKPGKHKVRGRFSDTRRKEVQEVRKRGACIRCRMLKKPCSGETPCGTCSSVDSARLWRHPCIRTRIAEEFGLYSAGLHTVLAFHALGNVKSQLQKIPGRMEVKHIPESTTYVTFLPLKGKTPLDPLLFGTTVDGTVDTSDPAALDADTDDLAGKMEQYIRKLAQTYHQTESSGFMQITLSTLAGFGTDLKDDVIMDDLIMRSLELWVATTILANRNITWQISLNASTPACANLVEITDSDIENDSKMSINRLPITPAEDHESYKIIALQLLGATEKRAATLSKSIMNDIERRLLQRQQAKPFETYLVSIVLLACVERMCWYFKTWEITSNETSTDTASVPADAAAELRTTLLGSEQQFVSKHWPLDKAPPYYSQQGERFSDVLVMLLRMRGVPPKPAVRQSDGVIIPVGEHVDDAVRDWFNRVSLGAAWLEERPNARFIGETPIEWEGKYWCKVINAILVR